MEEVFGGGVFEHIARALGPEDRASLACCSRGLRNAVDEYLRHTPDCGTAPMLRYVINKLSDSSLGPTAASDLRLAVFAAGSGRTGVTVSGLNCRTGKSIELSHNTAMEYAIARHIMIDWNDADADADADAAQYRMRFSMHLYGCSLFGGPDVFNMIRRVRDTTLNGDVAVTLRVHDELTAMGKSLHGLLVLCDGDELLRQQLTTRLERVSQPSWVIIVDDPDLGAAV